MHIIVDAMGGDDAPRAVVEGCVLAAKRLDVTLTLVGREAEIQQELKRCGYRGDRIRVVHAAEVIGSGEDPMKGIKKKDSSMRRALTMLKNDEGDVAVSAGNTGALISGATLLVKRIPGVRRVALAPVMPTSKGCFLLVDAGANAECTPAFLKQFAIMGSIYMESIMKVKNPRVRLINIGAEEEKGTPLITKTHQLLKELPIHYDGYIEGREVPLGGADVVVCDGFTGNVMLNFMEGMGIAFTDMVKQIFLKNAVTKLSALMVKGGLKDFKKAMDYTEYGGAPILGTVKPVIKAHGSSNANAFYHAICQAKRLTEEHLVDAIAENIQKYGQESGGSNTDE